ncbi:hypothetical protein [Pandoravirus japonicus]|uniref:Uncharacterized protein n=1 Tax=Pandoravirus japonicus TaxID=2823154 RepID=A0A811BNI2_9VIRU|nr:hypothetical protein [Pandoravirus japonicus]
MKKNTQSAIGAIEDACTQEMAVGGGLISLALARSLASSVCRRWQWAKNLSPNTDQVCCRKKKSSRSPFSFFYSEKFALMWLWVVQKNKSRRCEKTAKKGAQPTERICQRRSRACVLLDKDTHGAGDGGRCPFFWTVVPRTLFLFFFHKDAQRKAPKRRRPLAERREKKNSCFFSMRRRTIKRKKQKEKKNPMRWVRVARSGSTYRRAWP